MLDCLFVFWDWAEISYHVSVHADLRVENDESFEFGWNWVLWFNGTIDESGHKCCKNQNSSTRSIEYWLNLS